MCGYVIYLFHKRTTVNSHGPVPRGEHDAVVRELGAQRDRATRYGEVMNGLAGAQAKHIDELKALQPSPFKYKGEPFTRDDAALLGDALETDGWEISDPENAPAAVDALFDRMTTFLERHQRAVTCVPLDSSTAWIMGRDESHYQDYARQLRGVGHVIDENTDEQAYVICWMLNIYLQHRDAWRYKAQSELSAPRGHAANDPVTKTAANA